MANSSYSPSLTTTVSTLSRTVNQASHGFSVGNWLKLTGVDSYALAKADSAADAEVAGLVSSVIDSNNFVVAEEGLVTGLSGLTADTVYFLDPSTAGAMTTTEPSALGQVTKPIFQAISTTSGYVRNVRGIVIGANVITSFGPAGASHNYGPVPDPGNTAFTPPKVLTSDGLWTQQGWVPLQTLTAPGGAGVASLNFTGLTGFSSYVFVFNDVLPVTNGVGLALRVSVNNGVSYDASNVYRWCWAFATTAPVGGSGGTNNDSTIHIHDSVSNNSVTGVSGNVQLYPSASNENRTTGNMFTWQGSVYAVVVEGGVYATTGNIVNAVQFFFSSGNIATGSITAYGVR